MATTLPSGFESARRPVQSLSLAVMRRGWISWLPLVAVVALAFGLNAWSLSVNGWGNTYYAAAVRSMTLSWHNFFFGAFDPGGFITVDKPPVFLWVGALSARVFGYSSWSILLPSAFAGAASVALLWLIVRRYFGVLAATVAGLVLALTPIAVDVNRLNLPEPFYILALVGAAACILMSLESRRWWLWVIGAGVLVSVAFNTKMMAGWIPGPALALALVVGLPLTFKTALPTLLKQALPRLLLLAVATFAVSASWMLVVDAWPSSDRPYIGGSDNNSVSNLVFGYNGFGRVEGNQGPGGGGNRPNNAGGGFPGGVNPGAQDGGLRDGGLRDGNGGGTTPTLPGGNGDGFTRGNAFAGGTGGANGAGGIIAGTPGLFRMFDAANGAQIAWFLPFALIGGVLCLWLWRNDPLRRSAAVLWLGWVVLFGGVFSFAEGIYHSYYTAAMAPGIAAIAGMSTVGAGDLLKRNRNWFIAAAALVLATLWVQLVVTGRYDDHLNSLRPFAIVIVVAGLAVLAVTLLGRLRLPIVAGLILAVSGLLLLPAAWSVYETSHGALNTTLPQAGPRQGASGSSFGSQAFDGGVASLAAWLEAHQEPGATWDLVVSSAQNASTLIAEYELSVLPLGGFSGGDPTITAAQFADLVADGEVRYVLTSSSGAGGGGFNAGSGTAGSGAVLSAVQSACVAVDDRSLPTQYQGSLYDCAGAAADLAVQ